MPEECLDYFELSDRKRSHTWNTQFRQGWCDSKNNPKRKSIEWKGNNWYRIVGEAGTQIAENHGKSYLISKIFVLKNSPHFYDVERYLFGIQ